MCQQEKMQCAKKCQRTEWNVNTMNTKMYTEEEEGDDDDGGDEKKWETNFNVE